MESKRSFRTDDEPVEKVVANPLMSYIKRPVATIFSRARDKVVAETPVLTPMAEQNKVSESEGADPFYKEPSIARWKEKKEEKLGFSAAIEINEKGSHDKSNQDKDDPIIAARRLTSLD